MPATKPKPLWRCPKCGAKFVTRNLSHSCGRFTLAALFAKSEPHVLPLFMKYAALVRKLGRAVEMVPQKTRVVFVDRVRFSGATPRKDGFVVHFILGRPVGHARIVKHEFYPPHYHVSHVRIASAADLDATLRGWLRASHAYYGRNGITRSRWAGRGCGGWSRVSIIKVQRGVTVPRKW